MAGTIMNGNKWAGAMINGQKPAGIVKNGSVFYRKKLIGENWILQQIGIFELNDLRTIQFPVNQFVMGAYNRVADNVLTSPDGINWTRRGGGNTSNPSFTSSAYGAGLYVLGAGQGAANQLIRTSPDGITWTIRNHAGIKTPSWIKFGNNMFLCGGSYGSASGTGDTFGTSPDGITWTPR
ncbi:MAG: hypothetical protein FWF15_03445, partial [Oscillospiraceae bacterium]|nr:hypothetical protein [Oscillospiraceae bacterium]